MGEPIRITSRVENEDNWIFQVAVGEPRVLEYTVTVSQEVYRRLTGGAVPPETLVERSFEFLLERESKEAILRSFDLNVISNYFPEYEDEIGKRL